MIRFLPGETVKTVTVRVLGDTNVENDEDFFLKLYDPTFAILVDDIARGLIVDND